MLRRANSARARDNGSSAISTATTSRPREHKSAATYPWSQPTSATMPHGFAPASFPHVQGLSHRSTRSFNRAETNNKSLIP